MQRTRQTTTEKDVKSSSIKWVNNGGPFYMKDGRVIKNGESFLAAEDEIPMAFRQLIKPLDPTLIGTTVETVKLSYTIKQRKDTDYFDIFDVNGKKLNDKDLTEEEANDLVNSLMAK